MRLSAFIRDQHKHLNEFSDYWCEKHLEKPKDWPMEQAEASWEEQFSFYLAERDSRAEKK